MGTGDTRTVDDVLQSVSDALFPEHLGGKRVEINSRGMDDDTPLHVLVWRNDCSGAEILIAAGANINVVGDMSATPLYVAVGQNNLQMIQLLINAGANPDIRCEFGDTPRERALKAGGTLAQVFDEQP